MSAKEDATWGRSELLFFVSLVYNQFWVLVCFADQARISMCLGYVYYTIIYIALFIVLLSLCFSLLQKVTQIEKTNFK